jgi:hypothetical protein
VTDRRVRAILAATGRADRGAELYSRAATLGLLQDSVNTGRAEVPRLCDQAAHSNCTAAALLTLMADRTPVPVAARATASSSSSSR